MGIIIGYLLFCLILCVFNRKHSGINAILIFAVGTFINGFRSLSFGIDNEAYARYFESHSYLTLAQSWERVVTQEGNDPFYYFLGNLFSKMGFSDRGWFVFIAIVYVGGFCYLMYRYSKNYFISILFFLSQTYFYFSMSGLRQTLAMGVCFFAFDFAYRKKMIPFVLCVLLAMQFHSSALIFLLIYPIRNFKFSNIHWVVIAIALGVAVFAPETINRLIEQLAWNDNLADYASVTTGLSVAGFIIQLFILVFCLFFQRMDLKNEEQRRPWLNALTLGLVFQAFVINIDNIFRMSMYFSVYGAIAIPEAISLQRNWRNRVFLYMVVGAALFLYMIRSSKWSSFTMFGGV